LATDKPPLPVMKSAMCMRIRCMHHSKEARYQIGYYEEDNVVIIKCLACPPGMEVVRFKLAKNGCEVCNS
jgi:hypothetical protein